MLDPRRPPQPKRYGPAAQLMLPVSN